jgi:hypothetical protein
VDACDILAATGKEPGRAWLARQVTLLSQPVTGSARAVCHQDGARCARVRVAGALLARQICVSGGEEATRADLALAVVCIATPAAGNAFAVALACRSRGRYLVERTEGGLHRPLRTVCVGGALQARRRRSVFHVCDPVRAELSGCALVTCTLDEVLEAGVAHAVLDGGRRRAIQCSRVAGAR